MVLAANFLNIPFVIPLGMFYGLLFFGLVASMFLILILWFMRGPSMTLFKARFSRGSVLVAVEDDTGVIKLELAKWKDKANVLETNRNQYFFLPRIQTIPDRRKKIKYTKTNEDGIQIVESEIVYDESEDAYTGRVEKVNEFNELIKRKSGISGLNLPFFLAHASSCIASNPALADEFEDVKEVDTLQKSKKRTWGRIKENLNMRFTSVSILKEIVNSAWSPTDINEVRAEAYYKGLNMQPDKTRNPLVIAGGIMTAIIMAVFLFIIMSKGNVF